MSDTPKPPERRLRLTLDLGADDLDEIHSALIMIANSIDLDGREEREVTSGGWASGHHLKLVVTDPEMTGDRFRELLWEWRRACVARQGTAS